MKRFTETQKWDDPWFLDQSPEMKLIWLWLLDKCDNAGVVEPSIKLASFQIGYQYPMDTLSKLEQENRICHLKNGKWLVVRFISFQYGQISRDCKAHNPVFQSIEKNELDRVLIGYGYPLSTSKGKGQGTNQDQGQEEGAENPKSRGTEDEFREYAKSLGLLEADGSFLIDHLKENGWKRGKDAVKDWKATMRKWKSQGWLPSQKSQPAKTHRKNEYPQETLQLPD